MEYIVIYKNPDELLKTEYIKANTAQTAVNYVRINNPNAKIREVARIMKSWK